MDKYSVDAYNSDKDEFSASSRFSVLDSRRYGSIKTARDCAALTLPRILPPEGWSSNLQLTPPEQNAGSECVNKLASKLFITLFPPNVPFFRMALNELALADNVGGDKELLAKVKAEVEEKMSTIERACLKFMTDNGWFTSISEAILSLIVTGNSLLVYDDSSNRLRFIRLDNWVTVLDGNSQLVELIFRDVVHYSTLPADLVDNVKALSGGPQPDDGELFNLYTWVKRVDIDKYVSTQHLETMPIPDTEQTFNSENLPYIVTPWSLASCEDYGRGHVEDNIGDFRLAEALSISVAEYIAAATRVIPLVNPSGVTQIKDLSRSHNGEFIHGRADDISFVSLENKALDMQQAKAYLDETTQRLRRAFLTVSAIQRDAERVTAEEWRLMASELEDALGAPYALLGEKLQRPIANLALTHGLNKDIRKVFKDMFKLEAATGVSGLGRNHEYQSISMLMQAAVTIGATDYLHKNRALARMATLLNVNMSGIIVSDEELEAQAQAQAQAQQEALAADTFKGAVPKMAEAAMPQQNTGE